MSQLARSRRSGLTQPSKLCTSCLAAWALAGRQQPPLWGASGSSTASSISASSPSTFAGRRRHYATAREGPPADGTPAVSGAAPSTTEAAASFSITHVPGRVQRPKTRSRGRKVASLKGSPPTKTTQLKLWRETLDVMKKLEAAQGRLAEQAQTRTRDDPKGGIGNVSKTSTKKRSRSIAGTKGKASSPGSPSREDLLGATAGKDAQEQVHLLTNALHLLKTVLSTQGPQSLDLRPVAEGIGPTAGKSAKGPKNKPLKKKSNFPQSVPPASMAAERSITSAKRQESSVAAEAKGAQKKEKGDRSTGSEKRPVSAVPSKKTPTPKKTSAPPPSSRGTDVSSDQRSKPFSYLNKPLQSPFRVSKVNSKELALVPVEENKRPVPRLHYDLDRALFNPGVYHLQDPRSRVYNFDPYLASIMPLQEFDFNALKQYVTSSKDPTLIAMAVKHKMKYSGSTSSMTAMLSHFHFLLSGWRPVNPAHTSRSFTPESLNFTRISRAPAATFLHWKDGTYAIDADKEFDTANILSMLGKSMEKLLTLSKEDFEKYRVTKSHQLTEEERNDPESFHYTTFGDFMMRSQLDAHDPRLPGTGMFDLKTRAVVSIRMDAKEFHRGLGYEIRNRIGQWESFEREYFDMIRSAFLKYSLQVRMGRMDGIYVAFHNTQRIFGFQYIPVNEMDLALHGTEDRTLGDREFMLSLHLLNAVLDKAAARWPGRSLRLHIETRPSEAAPFMYIFAKPVEPREISEVQNANKASIEAFERNILGIVTEETQDESDTAVTEGEEAEEREEEEEENEDDGAESFDVWESMRQKVEETMENEAQGIDLVRDTIEDALEQSGLLRGRMPEETRIYVDALLEAVTRPDTEAVAENILSQGDSQGDGPDDTAALAEQREEEDNGGESISETARGAEEGSEVEISGTAVPSHESSAALSDEATPADANATGGSWFSKAVSSLSGRSPSPAASAEEDKPTNESETSSAADDIEPEEPDEISQTSSDASQPPPVPAASSPSDTISLKYLIIKLAAQVEASKERDSGSAAAEPDGKDTTVGSEILDAPTNKRFERILSEMVASSKETDEAADSQAEAESVDSAELAAAAATTTTASLEESSTTTDDNSMATSGPTRSSSSNNADEEILGMILTIRNKVNGRYVVRPERLAKSDSWTVEYAIEEIKPARRAANLYEMLQKRRRSLLGPKTAKPTSFDRDYMSKLYAISARGRRFRQTEDARARTKPVRVYGEDRELKWEEAFGSAGGEHEA